MKREWREIFTKLDRFGILSLKEEKMEEEERAKIRFRCGAEMIEVLVDWISPDKRHIHIDCCPNGENHSHIFSKAEHKKGFEHHITWFVDTDMANFEIIPEEVPLLANESETEPEI